MTNAEWREAFIRACEDAEHAEPVHLPANTPVTIGCTRFRAVYDSATDTTGLITEDEWRRRLDKARAHRAAAVAREVGVRLEEGQHARVIAGRSVFLIGWDDTVDDFVAIRADKADR